MLLGHRRRHGGVAAGAAAGRCRLLGQAEVEQLRLTPLGHEDVGRLDVAVHDPARMRRLEGVGDLGPQLEQRLERQRPRRQPFAQRFPFEQLHRDEGPPLVLVDVEDRADVGVLQRGRRPRLALKPFERLRVPDELFGQKLQRDAAAELDVLGLVDDAHAAASHSGEDAIVRNGLTDHP